MVSAQIWGNGSKHQWIMPAGVPFKPPVVLFPLLVFVFGGFEDHFLDRLSNPRHLTSCLLTAKLPLECAIKVGILCLILLYPTQH